MGSLIPVDDGPVARCKLCGKTAVGPCARCRSPVCGDCCELTEGGATTFAVCLTCVKRGGKSLSGGWLGLIGWLGAIILGLAAIAAALVLAGCGGGSFQTSGGTGSSSRLALADGYAYWFDPFVGLGRAPLDAPAQRTQLTRDPASDGHLHLNATHGGRLVQRPAALTHTGRPVWHRGGSCVQPAAARTAPAVWLGEIAAPMRQALVSAGSATTRARTRSSRSE